MPDLAEALAAGSGTVGDQECKTLPHAAVSARLTHAIDRAMTTLPGGLMDEPFDVRMLGHVVVEADRVGPRDPP